MPTKKDTSFCEPMQFNAMSSCHVRTFVDAMMFLSIPLFYEKTVDKSFPPKETKTIIQLCVSSDVTRQSNSCFVSLHLSVSCAVLLARDARNASYSSSWLTKNHESFSCGQQERLARSSGQHGISYGAVGTA